MDKAQQTIRKTEQKLRRQMSAASADYGLIEAGDRLMVCLSGGKDSYTMLALLQQIQVKAPFHFDLMAVNLDQKQPGFPAHILPDYLAAQGVPFHIAEEDTYSIVQDKIPVGKTTCGLCSRLRRGILYRLAGELNCNKIALGHHQDDVVETLFLNMFFGGTLKAMPPKLVSDDGHNTVIRPLYYCREKDIKAYADVKDFPIIPCNLCGSQDNLQRQAIKQMLQQWEKIQPGRIDNIARAIKNIAPTQLGDGELIDFKALKSRVELPQFV